MRKTLVNCLVASFALWLGGCGDDDDACTGTCVQPDSATTETDSDSDSDESTTTGRSSATQSSNTSETEADSGGASTDAGSTSDTSSDGGSGGDSGTDVETDADVPVGDGGSTSADAGDAGEEETDAGSGDASTPSGTPCEQACANLAEKGCEDPECTFCDIPEVSPDCVSEANAYLECIAEADPEEFFECNEDGVGGVVGTECDDPYFNAWAACAFE